MTQLTRWIVAGRWFAIVGMAVALAGCGGGNASSAGASSSQSVSSSGAGSPVNSQSSGPTSTPTVSEATLSWAAPDENTDGSALTNLAGYRIYFGTSADALDQVIDIPTVGITEYVVDNLTAGTYYFSIRAYNSAGAESALSNIVSDTIS
jgi:hypothetical protein